MIAAGVDQMHRDSNPLAESGRCALDHGVHLQLPTDFGERHLASFVPHRRSSRDDAQCSDLRQIGRQRIGDSLRKIILTLFHLLGKAFERQHDKRSDVAR